MAANDGLYITSDLLTLVSYVNIMARPLMREQTGLSITQYRILSVLERQATSMYVKDIGAYLQLSVPTITEALKELQAKGYVEKDRDDADRRMVSVALSSDGQHVIREGDLALAHFVQDLWRPIPDEYKNTLIDGALQIDRRFKGTLPQQDARLISLYLEVFFITQSVFEAEVKQHGITVGQFRVLFELAQRSEPVSMKNLGRTLLIRPNKLTPMADALVERGLAERCESTADLRSFMLSITDAGRALEQKVSPAIDRAFSQGTYDTSPEDRRTYIDEADLIVRDLRQHW